MQAKYEAAAYISAGAIAGAAVLVAAYYALEVMGLRSPIPGMGSWEDFAAIALAVALAPYTILDLRRAAWSRSIESNLPRLLADLEGLVESGMSPLNALRQASSKDYGALNGAVRRVVTLTSWGYSIERIKGMIESDVQHSVAALVMKLLLDAEEGGGDVAAAVKSIREYVRETSALKGELQSTVRMQVLVVYLALVIFLYVSSTVISTFLSAGGAVAGIGLTTSAAGSIRETLFNMYLIEAVLGGLAVGKMTSGRLGSGVKHSLILVLIGAAYLIVLG